MSKVATGSNEDKKTVEGFGQEWVAFDQTDLPPAEQLDLFNTYFSVFPWGKVGKDAVGFDMGCGSGRWAELAAVAGATGSVRGCWRPVGGMRPR